MSESKPRMTLQKRIGEWELSYRLFGNIGYNIYDFEMGNYVYFLDNIKSLADLIEGLFVLSPLADDALEVAEQMNENDFYDFKIALARERGICQRGGEIDSIFPTRYMPLLIPEQFVLGNSLADKFEVSLGTALIRVIESRKA